MSARLSLSPHYAENCRKKQKLCEVPQCDEIFDNAFDDSMDMDIELSKFVPYMDLTNWQRCIVESLEQQQQQQQKRLLDLVLYLRAENESEESRVENPSVKCHLQSPWNSTHVQIGDLLSIKAVWDPQLNAYKVDANNGFCVTHPDTLISGTGVVGSLFCRRKAVLADKFRDTDLSNGMMVVGTIVHEILQIVLKQGLKTLKDIEDVAERIMNSTNLAITLCSSTLSQKDLLLEVQNFLPNILTFVNKYVDAQDDTKAEPDCFQGKITQIQDIEENVWIPQLGLKGKIDVSVRIQRQRKIKSQIEEDLPLELKTGRSTFSMEHKGQLILYQMMLTEIGRMTQSGLLLYLRDGVISEIRGSRNEQRDLIMLRNDISYYTCDPLTDLISSKHNEVVKPFALPEPISHRSACKSCSYSRICSGLAQFDSSIQFNDEHPFRKHMNEVTSHLRYEDLEYFVHWCGLLALEDQENRKNNILTRSLWTETPEKRQQKGCALIDLTLDKVAPFELSKYLHVFRQNSSTPSESEFSISEYVIVSTQKRLAVATGFIHNIDNNSITISLERNLNDRYSGQKFIVDKHASHSGNVFNFTSLGMLLKDTDRCSILRDIIVRRNPTIYRKILPKIIATKGPEILKPLNAGQRNAALKALTAENFILIKGLPGTGKTQTLVAIVRLLHLMGKSILITSHTHSAVDNVLLRLKPFNIAMLRLGADVRINPQLLEYSENTITKDCQTQEDFMRVYKTYNIVGVTCLGAEHCIFLHRKFDVCIVDEATQVMQCTVLRPLYFCEKFILVGDPKQLPPLIRSREARKRGADESLFQRLDTESSTVVLTQQYRMNKTITKLANDFTYAGAMQCGSNIVQTATIKLQKCIFVTKKEKWLQRVLQSSLQDAIIMLDTLNCEERSTSFAKSIISIKAPLTERITEDPNKAAKMTNRLLRCANYCEAAIVLHIVKALHLSGYNPDNIGLIAPYRAQVELLRKIVTLFYNSMKMSDIGSHVEVNTVDQFQGRDKDIIIYSCTKTGFNEDRNFQNSNSEILHDRRRLNVAITRAKFKLILIGNADCLRNYDPFLSLFSHISNSCKMQLENDKNDFNWKDLMAQLYNIINL